MSSKFRYKQGLVRARTPMPAPIVPTTSNSTTDSKPPAQTTTTTADSSSTSTSTSTPATTSSAKESQGQGIDLKTTTTTKSKTTRSNRSNKPENPQYYRARHPADAVRDVVDDIGYDLDPRKPKRKTGEGMARSARVLLEETIHSPWSPTPYAAFKLLVSSRFAAALWTTISDCDETYNYWEPAHYLLYGKGFQTWEYSPAYALRSYTYILIHAVPAKFYDFFLHPNPLLIFFFIRCLLAFVSALTELFLYRGVRRYFGGNVARIALVTSLFAPGMFISSAAFLPSSFSSYMTALALGAWLEELYELSILAVAVSALLSWPFAALTGFFIAFDIVVLQRRIWLFASWSLISLAVVLLPIIAIDSNHYGKLVIAPLNIVKYNIFSSKGPELYGTEPWSFYVVNGTLNFNIMFILAIVSPLVLFLSWKACKGGIALKEKLIIIATMLLWLMVFILQPHKEERFLFPIFPLIPVCGGIALDSLLDLVENIHHRIARISTKSVQAITRVLRKWDTTQIKSILALVLVVGASTVGCSRMIALHYGYRAPFDIFFNLHREGAFIALEAEDVNREFVLCYGKEWYRFPTSFFLPSHKWSVRFIQSDFKGQLPNLYPTGDPEGTKIIPENMNDDNKEEPSRYVLPSECDFLVDSFSPDDDSGTSLLEPNYAANTKEWTVISEQDFLNAGKSSGFFRAFYIPFLSAQKTTYDRYVLLKRIQGRTKERKKGRKRPTNKIVEESTDGLDDEL